MKRAGNLMEAILRSENLHEAFLLAFRGKSGKAEAMAFRDNLDAELQRIACGLQTATYDFGHYREFYVYEPKRRAIYAAPFAMRVALQAMMRVCHPVFDSYQMPHSFASRVGMGQYKAIARAQQLCRHYEWFAKLDVRKFFDSIDHEVLLGQLCRLFKDRVLMENIVHLLDSYHTRQCCGLPIGNLSSQYFANHYLAVADHHAKEVLRVGPMVRYMDDVLLFAHRQSELMGWVRGYTDFAARGLRLQLHDLVVNRTCHGLPFLGYVVWPHELRLTQNSRHRLQHKLATLHRDYDDGMLSDADCRNRLTAVMAFAAKASVASLMKRNLGMLS